MSNTEQGFNQWAGVFEWIRADGLGVVWLNRKGGWEALRDGISVRGNSSGASATLLYGDHHAMSQTEVHLMRDVTPDTFVDEFERLASLIYEIQCRLEYDQVDRMRATRRD